MSSGGRQLREGWRALRRTPGASVAAWATLVVGLGVSLAIFNALYAALWQPLPYAHSGELVVVTESVGPLHGFEPSANDVRALAADSTVFSGAAVGHQWFALVTGHGPAQQVDKFFAGPALFRLLGVEPRLGRAFTASDVRPGAAPVVILGAAFARKRFPDASPLGQTLTLDGVPYQIIGVLPANFGAFLGPGSGPSMIVPLILDAQSAAAGEYFALARLRPGVSLTAARAEAAAVAAHLAHAPGPRGKFSFALQSLDTFVHAHLGTTPWLLLGAAGLILLLACVNVASLLLARVSGRSRELAIRQALGAGRGRLMGQVVIEGLLLGAAGGVGGWWAAWALLRLLQGLHPPGWLASGAPSATPLPLLFAVGLSLAAGLLCSLVPAWRAGLPAFGQQATAPRRLRGGVIALEVAVALVLAVSAALLIRTVARLQAVPLGFNPAHVLTAQIALPPAQRQDAAATTAFYSQLEQRAQALPGVSAAALTDFLTFWSGQYTRAERGGASASILEDNISPGYLRTLEISLLRGRSFAASDTAYAPAVAIVSQKMARQWWPQQNPIGQKFRLVDKHHAGPWTVVGVAQDVHQSYRGERLEPEAYFPLAQYPASSALPGLTLVARSSGDAAALAAPLTRAVTALDPEAVVDAEPMSALVQTDLSSEHFLLELLALAAALALVLAALEQNHTCCSPIPQERNQPWASEVVIAGSASVIAACKAS